MKVVVVGEDLGLSVKFDPITVDKIKQMPQRKWDAKLRLWKFKPIEANLNFVKSVFPEALWDDDADKINLEVIKQQLYREQVAKGLVDASDDLKDVPMRLKPYDHQRKALVLGRDQKVFAYLMDQGTGKSKVLCDDAAHNFRKGLIDSLIIICPNSVKTNWVNMDPNPLEKDEIDKHMAPDIPYVKAAWFSNMNKSQQKEWDKFWETIPDRHTLKIVSVNVESMHVQRVFETIKKFCQNTRALIAVDESTRIKNRNAGRTKNSKKLRQLCPMARIMSGTPLIKSPLDAYSQFDFLDPNILGYPTYASFQAHFAVTGGFQGKQVLYFKNLDELSNKVAGVSFRIMKDQCLDLPPKVYSKRSIEMTAKQRSHYEDMKHEMVTWLDKEHVVDAPVILTQLLRLQQITAGYLPIVDSETMEQTGIERICDSPKVEEAMDIIDECQGKVIVWCRFKFEIQEMHEALTKAGIGHVLFYGEVNESDRIKARSSFQTDEKTRVFVGQIRTGGIGLTLTAANTVIYMSNTFSTEDRVQSEDRAHRIGQTHSVEYIDLICNSTIDTKVLSVLRSNKKISDEVMRDGLRAWL